MNASRSLSFEDAVEIWLLLWKGVYRNRITAMFDCNNWRLYEIWREEKFIGSREIALKRLRKVDPMLADRAASGVLDPKKRRFKFVPITTMGQGELPF